MKTVIRRDSWIPSIFDEFFPTKALAFSNHYETFSAPKVNVTENLSNFVIELAVPGLKKEDFSIEIEEDSLIIAAKQETEKTESVKDDAENLKYIRKEFNFGTFTRRFILPEIVNADAITANYENGVLQISLPKKEEKKALKKMVEIS